MATQAPPQLASKIIGPLVVSAVVAVAGGGVVLRDAVIELRSEVDHLKAEAAKGGRFTSSDGARHEKQIHNLRTDFTKHLIRGEGGFRQIQQNTQDIQELKRGRNGNGFRE